MTAVWAWALWIAVPVGAALFLVGHLMVATVAADLGNAHGRNPVRPAVRALAVVLIGTLLIAVGMGGHYFGWLA